jgi:myo-inositol-1(or 4)-monophosphatase
LCYGFFMPEMEIFLKQLLVQAGKKLHRHFGRVKTVSFKDGSSINLVTNVDQEVEKFVKDQIRKRFPEDSILAEESEMERADADRKWIIDPLDGTTNFAHGLPLFSISIAVEVAGKVVAGGVNCPVYGELFFASKGKGATLNGKKIKVSRVRKLKQSLLVTGFPYDVDKYPERSLPYFNALIQRAQGVRRLGSAAMDLCYLAMGRFEGFFEVFLNPWDTAAGALILLEAGGIITDFDGRPHSIYQRELAASNGLIQKEMLQVIHRVKSGQIHEVAL